LLSFIVVVVSLLLLLLLLFASSQGRTTNKQTCVFVTHRVKKKEREKKTVNMLGFKTLKGKTRKTDPNFSLKHHHKRREGERCSHHPFLL